MKSNDTRLRSTRIRVKNAADRQRLRREPRDRRPGRRRTPVRACARARAPADRRRRAAATRSRWSRTGRARSRARGACVSNGDRVRKRNRNCGLVSRKNSQPPIIRTNVSAICTAASGPGQRSGRRSSVPSAARDHEQQAVIEAPQHEVPARAVPEARTAETWRARWSRAAATGTRLPPSGM